MIKVITNSLGSGDWVMVTQDDNDIWGGRSVNPYDLADILSQLGMEVEYVKVDDTQLELGLF